MTDKKAKSGKEIGKYDISLSNLSISNVAYTDIYYPTGINIKTGGDLATLQGDVSGNYDVVAKSHITQNIKLRGSATNPLAYEVLGSDGTYNGTYEIKAYTQNGLAVENAGALTFQFIITDPTRPLATIPNGAYVALQSSSNPNIWIIGSSNVFYIYTFATLPLIDTSSQTINYSSKSASSITPNNASGKFFPKGENTDPIYALSAVAGSSIAYDSDNDEIYAWVATGDDVNEVAGTTSTNDTQLATTSFVKTLVDGVVQSAGVDIYEYNIDLSISPFTTDADGNVTKVYKLDGANGTPDFTTVTIGNIEKVILSGTTIDGEVKAYVGDVSSGIFSIKYYDGINTSQGYLYLDINIPNLNLNAGSIHIVYNKFTMNSTDSTVDTSESITAIA